MLAILSLLSDFRVSTVGKRDPFSLMLNKTFSTLISLILKISDPLIDVKVGNRNIVMNLSHNLPLLIAHNPFYDTALTRLCVHIKNAMNRLIFVDVGANIGDTISLITDAVEGEFLCVEGDSEFYNLLVKNTKDIKNVVCEQVLLGDSVNAQESLVKKHGTAQIALASSSQTSLAIEMTSLDNLVQKNKTFLETNILKIDTDGYDYKVIRGSLDLISHAKPVIFFELAPQFLLDQGENLLSIFGLLKEHGYQTALFYDNRGYPLVKLDTSNLLEIKQILNYALFKKDFYFDVLLFHSSLEKSFDDFYVKEVSFFGKKCNEPVMA